VPQMRVCSVKSCGECGDTIRNLAKSWTASRLDGYRTIELNTEGSISLNFTYDGVLMFRMGSMSPGT